MSFPTSPTNGQKYKSYIFDGSKWIQSRNIDYLINVQKTYNAPENMISGTVLYDTIKRNDLSSYNSSTGEIIVSYDGLYEIIFHVDYAILDTGVYRHGNATAILTTSITSNQVIGGSIGMAIHSVPAGSYSHTGKSFNGLVKLNCGDKIKISVSAGATNTATPCFYSTQYLTVKYLG